MTIYISSNIFKAQDLPKLFSLVEQVNGSVTNQEIGIELFPEFHNPIFLSFLEKELPQLQTYEMSLHGPYVKTEHSAPKGSAKYEEAKEYFIKSLELAQQVKGKYIVFHHNNSRILEENRKSMIEHSSKNLVELNEIAKYYNIKIVVENAGVNHRQNALFNESEFIKMAKEVENDILIDIGHAIANHWDLKNLIFQLKDKIVAYHLHNNNGIDDLHDSILEGSYDMNAFIKLYKQYTPDADLVVEYGDKYNEWNDIMVRDIKWLKEKLDN